MSIRAEIVGVYCRSRLPSALPPIGAHLGRRSIGSRRGDRHLAISGRLLPSWPNSRGPLVAQTSIGRLAQPSGAGLTRESTSPANEAVRRGSSLGVVLPDSACHAGGRGFESRRSRLYLQGFLRLSVPLNLPGWCSTRSVAFRSSPLGGPSPLRRWSIAGTSMGEASCSAIRATST